MEDYQILGLSLCTYENNEDEIKKSAREFDVTITNVKQYKAGIKDIDSCYIADAGDIILLAFRGTTPPSEDSIIPWDLLNNFLAEPVEVTGIPGKLHKGFSNSVNRLWEEGFAEEVTKRLTAGKSLYITGYSKGAALTPIAASFLDQKTNIDVSQVKIYIFEPPRPGDAQFKTYFNQRFPTAIRYEYQDDIVPHLPPIEAIIDLLIEKSEIAEILNKYLGLDEWDYKSVGNLRFVNWEDEILTGIQAKLEFVNRLLHLKNLVEEGNIEKMMSDHSPQEHLYPVLSGGKPYPPNAVKVSFH